MADDLIIQYMRARLEMDALRDRTDEEWRRECNAKGLEIYYDMSNATEHGVGCNYDCDEDCDEIHTILVGQYKMRPCTKHFKGHACNPPRHARITNLAA